MDRDATWDGVVLAKVIFQMVLATCCASEVGSSVSPFIFPRMGY